MHRCSDQNVGSPWPDDHRQRQDVSFRNRDWISDLASPPPMIRPPIFKKKTKPRNTSVPPKGCFFSVFVNCCRPWLVTRPWPSAWWMQRCTQTWACWCRWRPSSTAAYSFIKWFVSLLMHSEERAIWTSWVSELREKLSHFLIYRTRGREIKWSDIILYPRYLSQGWNWEHKCFYRLITKGNMRSFSVCEMYDKTRK